METLRYSFEILTKQFIDEQTRENFVTPSTPGPNDLKWAAPYFTQYGITPEEAFKVLIDFDKEPKDLTQDDLNIRIRALAALDMALNNNEFVLSLKKTANEYAASSASSDAANAAAAIAAANKAAIAAANAANTGSITAGTVPSDGGFVSSPKTQYYQFFANNIDAGIVLMRRLIGLLIMESASACSTTANCFNDILGKFAFKRTSISDKIDKIIQTNNQTIMSLNTDLNGKTGIIQLDEQTIKSLNTMLSGKNNEIEKKQNENAELSKMYNSVFAERDEMVEKNRILVEESKKLITIPNVLIVVLVCIIAYLFVTKK